MTPGGISLPSFSHPLHPLILNSIPMTLLYRVERGIYTPRNPKRKGLPLPLFTAALRKSTGERIEGDGMAENVLLGLIAQVSIVQ